MNVMDEERYDRKKKKMLVIFLTRVYRWEAKKFGHSSKNNRVCRIVQGEWKFYDRAKYAVSYPVSSVSSFLRQDLLHPPLFLGPFSSSRSIYILLNRNSAPFFSRFQIRETRVNPRRVAW